MADEDREEGWSESQVHSVLLQFRSLAAYRAEIRDHWDTLREFMKEGFSGDCKNIAIYEMGALKQLNYPYGIRILIVHAIFEDPCPSPGGDARRRMEGIDVVSEGVPSPKPGLLKPVAEFDEKQVSWYPPEAGMPDNARRSNSVAAISGSTRGIIEPPAAVMRNRHNPHLPG